MKTKKISWQAIAIVVLALVLIASIALGVSGAWFQDKDSEKVDATMGQAVTIKLANKADGGPVETWNSLYTGATKGAFPGDKLLGATKVVPGSTAPMILRAKILTKIMDGATEVTKPTSEPTLGDADNNKGTDYADTPVYTDNEKNYNAWVLHTELAKSGLDIATEGDGKWIKGKTKIESEGDVAGGSEFYYYNKIVEGGDVVLFEEGLSIPVTITNAAHGWTITVTILVEAMQAANITDATLANPWQADLPSVVETTANGIIR